MQFQPRTAKEIAEKSLWPKGIYDFEIESASEEKSGPKSKNPGVPYIKLNVTIFNEKGYKRHVKDNLHPAFEVKLRHFAEATGLIDKYDSGSLSASDCVGRAGKCKLIIKEDEGYEPKNEIRDYVRPKQNKTESPEQVQSEQGADDPLPF